MAVSTERVAQAIARFGEADTLYATGFRDRAVEALHLSGELAVEEIATRHSIEIPHEQVGWHEARARAARQLRQAGHVPAGFDNLLRRLNDDRKRTKYDEKPTRYDPGTFAQAQASVKIVIETLGGTLDEAKPEAEAEPAPAPPHRPAWVVPALAAVAAAAVAALVAVLALGGGDERTTPPRRASAIVAYGARATVARL